MSQMDLPAIRKEIIKLLLGYYQGEGVDELSIEEIDIHNDLGIDSIRFIGLIIELETAFGITIPDDLIRIELFKNVSSIIDIVSKCIMK